MNRYKKISWKEYNAHLRDILVFGTYPNNDTAETLIYKLAKSKSKFKYVIFNLRNNLREELEQKIKDEALSNIYIDTEKDPNIDYIECRCKELWEQDNYCIIFIDCEGTLNYNNEDFKRLKELCVYLNTNIIFTIDLNTNKKYPKLEDIYNKYLVEYADVIVLRNEKKDTQSILAKNKHGKTGILYYDKD